ncbi:hypothetical protein [Georgenia sp. SUBG003]|uniref:hypothetical protein n=1 Tax=Georgenia sp. SUBG003 TaxID=1497974 RepID=UPI003AB8BFE1
MGTNSLASMGTGTGVAAAAASTAVQYSRMLPLKWIPNRSTPSRKVQPNRPKVGMPLMPDGPPVISRLLAVRRMISPKPRVTMAR